MANVSDVVQKGMPVKVKVLSYTGNKMSLSLKVILSKDSLNYCLTPSQTANFGEDQIERIC